MTDEQDQAESLDEDVVDDVDDYDGDEFGEGLPEYPPDAPMAVDGVDDDAEDDSFAERSWREEPDFGEPGARHPAADHIGQIADPYAAADEDRVDHEERVVADELGGHDDGPEAGALHLER